MKHWGGILNVVGLGLLAGGMLFFGAVMAPLVFTRLPPPVAGGFIGQIFPWYFGYGLAMGALALIGALMGGQRRRALLLALVAASNAWGLFWLIPLLNRLRAAHDSAGFSFWHLVSTSVNGAAFFVTLLLLARAGFETSRPPRAG
ncbi:DUF4149 domain-containing protein [Acidocella sp.]|uniref:DUF4149 domain-containing protein n=1 Tax=Acidocella sp. TaxID=50710 RepID=UPI002603A389|nr:DUF4149 domain-containing protein [Acidocella sp.]